jgi:hypothetical protein
MHIPDSRLTAYRGRATLQTCSRSCRHLFSSNAYLRIHADIHSTKYILYPCTIENTPTIVHDRLYRQSKLAAQKHKQTVAQLRVLLAQDVVEKIQFDGCYQCDGHQSFCLYTIVILMYIWMIRIQYLLIDCGSLYKVMVLHLPYYGFVVNHG